MKELDTPIQGLRLFEMQVHRDSRGFFLERWSRERMNAAGIDASFAQDNHSRSAPGVLRGLHFQKDPPQAKLISVVRGRVFDVAVDLRKGSASYGRWFAAELSDENARALWIPYGFAHGFCVLGDEPADMYYKVTGAYNPRSEGGIRWDDPEIGVEWPLAQPQVSGRDAGLPNLCGLTLG